MFYSISLNSSKTISVFMSNWKYGEGFDLDLEIKQCQDVRKFSNTSYKERQNNKKRLTIIIMVYYSFLMAVKDLKDSKERLVRIKVTELFMWVCFLRLYKNLPNLYVQVTHKAWILLYRNQTWLNRARIGSKLLDCCQKNTILKYRK